MVHSFSFGVSTDFQSAGGGRRGTPFISKPSIYNGGEYIIITSGPRPKLFCFFPTVTAVYVYQPSVGSSSWRVDGGGPICK